MQTNRGKRHVREEHDGIAPLGRAGNKLIHGIRCEHRSGQFWIDGKRNADEIVAAGFAVVDGDLMRRGKGRVAAAAGDEECNQKRGCADADETFPPLIMQSREFIRASYAWWRRPELNRCPKSLPREHLQAYLGIFTRDAYSPERDCRAASFD